MFGLFLLCSTTCSLFQFVYRLPADFFDTSAYTKAHHRTLGLQPLRQVTLFGCTFRTHSTDQHLCEGYSVRATVVSPSISGPYVRTEEVYHLTGVYKRPRLNETYPRLSFHGTNVRINPNRRMIVRSVGSKFKRNFLSFHSFKLSITAV